MVTPVNDHPTLTHEAVRAALADPEVSPAALGELAILAAQAGADQLARTIICASQSRAARVYSD